MGRRATFLLAGLLLAACSTSSETESRPTVNVFGPYRSAEAANFTSSLESFEDDTGIDIRYVGTGSIAADLTSRLEEGDPPDVAIIPQPALVGDFVERRQLVPLDAEVRAAVEENYSPELIDIMTFEDDLYGVMYRASVKSLVWYPPDEFEALGYEVPRTWDELLVLTERMEGDGFEPWCFAIESFDATGWVGTDWIEDLMIRTAGPEAYSAWAAGEIRFDDARVEDSFRLFGQIVRAPGRVLGGTRRALGVRWTDAGSPMFTSPAECLLHRQASFYFSSIPEELELGTDYDVFALPSFGSSSAPPIVLAGDLAVAFNARPEVQQLLAYLATPEAGAAWAEAGGYLSPHQTFDSGSYGNPFERRVGEIIDAAEFTVFDASDTMTPSVGTGSFWTGIVYYLQTGDLESTLSIIESGYEP